MVSTCDSDRLPLSLSRHNVRMCMSPSAKWRSCGHPEAAEHDLDPGVDRDRVEQHRDRAMRSWMRHRAVDPVHAETSSTLVRATRCRRGDLVSVAVSGPHPFSGSDRATMACCVTSTGVPGCDQRVRDATAATPERRGQGH